jgi:hypothetical protein
MSPQRAPAFDPRPILAALQREEVHCVLIGGLARVLRGSDEVTAGVDVCPSLKPVNLQRLQAALTALSAARVDGRELSIEADGLTAESVIELATPHGELKLVVTPAGVPRGFDALTPGASREHLGHGLRPAVAGTADLVAMSAALRRDADLQRLPMLRRILELEAAPSRLVGAQSSPMTAGTHLNPGDADRLSRSTYPPATPGSGIER